MYMFVSCGVRFGETGPPVSPGFAYRRAWKARLGGCCAKAIRIAMSILADGAVEIFRATESLLLVPGLPVVCKAPAPLPGCSELAAAYDDAEYVRTGLRSKPFPDLSPDRLRSILAHRGSSWTVLPCSDVTVARRSSTCRYVPAV